ncbi:MAG TPA: hypothetical protein VNF51_03250 [Candidatus Paceibacterota bacterium]|nr:hypothetical protein [Candidatus Paceibacterota bacterium]
MKSPFFHLVLACVICVGALIGYGIWYTIIESESATVDSLKNQITTNTENTSRIASARVSLAEIAGDEASIQNYFVSESGVVAFINALEALGQAQGAAVSILSVSTSGTVAHPSLTFALAVRGTFDACMRTVGAIEYAPYDLSISTLSLGQDGKNSWHADLTLLVGSVPAAVASSTP